MSRIDKKSPLRVPNGYFEYFEKNMEKLIKSTDTKDGFMTPPNYLQKAEDQILNNINYSKGENTFVFEKLWKIVAAAAVLTLFIFNEKKAINQKELADFFLENYLNENTTYEIADHSNYYFETISFIENYDSFAIQDAFETILYGETPTNLNFFDDE